MPGIGKTTSIHCLAHALLGDAYKEGVMELNASDERWVPLLNVLVIKGGLLTQAANAEVSTS
jgi:DNA polymerase III delta prime subunit